jgi:proline iminopeptidase
LLVVEVSGPPGYPPIKPYAHGMLDAGEGQRLSWEVSGKPTGKPAVVLHGGPGSGSSLSHRRWFDPLAHRIVQFDQRGCGRSTPPVSDPATDLSTNTTEHLIADIERLQRPSHRRGRRSNGPN